MIEPQEDTEASAEDKLEAHEFLMDQGLSVDPTEDDLFDEMQFLHTNIAEDVDEEDMNFGLSDQMRGLYNE
tara:strand:+ start:575 stop:787 length:213 start_codon:yes stop_codon:yes gene_type:complete